LGVVVWRILNSGAPQACRSCPSGKISETGRRFWRRSVMGVDSIHLEDEEIRTIWPWGPCPGGATVSDGDSGNDADSSDSGNDGGDDSDSTDR
jgi:hypothetical protein